jgi:hypothetical protein
MKDGFIKDGLKEARMISGYIFILIFDSLSREIPFEKIFGS